MTSHAKKTSHSRVLMLSAAAALVYTSAIGADAAKDAAGPSYDETVAYISGKFQQAGIPGSTDLQHFHSQVITRVTDDVTFSFSVDSCNSMIIARKESGHTDDPTEAPSHSESSSTNVVTIPFSSLAMDELQIADHSEFSPKIFSTHTVSKNVFGTELADGYPISRWKMSDSTIGGNKGEWDDSIYIVAKDSGITWKQGDTKGAMNPNVPLPIVAFWLPGTGALSTHVAKAIQHLADICINHPSQSPKEAF
jgi:hypothetical protein